MGVKGEQKYEFTTIFQLQFFIHLLGDVHIELNKLNKKFQEDHVDITYFDTNLHVSISILRKWFLESIFGVDAVHMSSFLVNA